MTDTTQNVGRRRGQNIICRFYKVDWRYSLALVFFSSLGTHTEIVWQRTTVVVFLPPGKQMMVSGEWVVLFGTNLFLF